MKAERTDTLLLSDNITSFTFNRYDTTFYSNGNLLSVEHYQATEIDRQRQDIEWFSKKYYTQDGALRVDLGPDSLHLTPFKDNVDCYYGLKNQYGDTIYTAQFDHIEAFEDEFWLAYQGTRVTLMYKNGKIVSKLPMNNVTHLRNQQDNYKSYNLLRLHDAYDLNFWKNLSEHPQYFSFKSEGKYGVIDRNGLLILPPQYPEFESVDSLGNWFLVSEKKDHSDLEEFLQLVDRKGNYFLNKRYPWVCFTQSPDVFAFSTTAPADTTHWQYKGLIHQSGEVLLEPIYANVTQPFLQHKDNVYWIGKGQESFDYKGKRVFSNLIHGAYDAKNRRWLMPCAYENLSSFFGLDEYSDNDLFILEDTLTHKSGTVSFSGKVILPFVYDQIERLGGGSNICYVVQNGRYQIYDAERQRMRKDVYQYLRPQFFYEYNDSKFRGDYNASHGSRIAFFIAQKDNKWGVIDLNGTVIIPLIYDYLGKDDGLAFVKNNKGYIVNEYEFPMFRSEKVDKPYNSQQMLASYTLVGKGKYQQFILDSLNRVFLPPQYWRVEKRGSWEILEDSTKKWVILFPYNAQIEPFPFTNKIEYAQANHSLAILGLQESKGFEVVNRRTGQVYQTIRNGGFAVVDYRNGTYFLKADTQKIIATIEYDKRQRVCSDTLLMDDNNWRLYDSVGKALTTNVFRYPIQFQNGVGIGAVGDKFGVWRLDGSVVIPPQYDNARFEATYQRLVMYQNRGLKTWLLLFDRTGKLLVNAGRYDGISTFYGKYALVSLGDKTGLIDSLGTEIIAPTSLDNDQFNLMDSLNVVHHYIAQKEQEAERKGLTYSYGERIYSLPISINYKNAATLNPDSLALPNARRNHIWQYLLATQIGTFIKRADFKHIDRTNATKTYNIYREGCDRPETTDYLRHLFTDSLHISFALLSDSAAKSIFKNYWLTKNGWQQKQLSDILNLSRDNILKINDLLRQKIKKLEDEEIDCGESTSFVERTRTTFLSHKEGISFYFTSIGYEKDSNRRFYYVPILLTWSELKPFLTPQ